MYGCGGLDNRYGEPASFTGSRRVTKSDDVAARLDYYSSHRVGREAGLRKSRLIEAS